MTVIRCERCGFLASISTVEVPSSSVTVSTLAWNPLISGSYPVKTPKHFFLICIYSLSLTDSRLLLLKIFLISGYLSLPYKQLLLFYQCIKAIKVMVTFSLFLISLLRPFSSLPSITNCHSALASYAQKTVNIVLLTSQNIKLYGHYGYMQTMHVVRVMHAYIFCKLRPCFKRKLLLKLFSFSILTFIFL